MTTVDSTAETTTDDANTGSTVATDTSTPEATTTTTVIETTTTTEPPPPPPRLGTDLGPVTDSIPFPDAPGIDAAGEFYELAMLSYLFLPIEPSEDPALVPTEEHLDILAVYALAQKGVAEQVITNPVAAEPNDLIRAAYADEGVGVRDELLSIYVDREIHQVFPTGAPDIARPRIDVDSVTQVSATILDCFLLSSGTANAQGEVLFPDAPAYQPVGFEIRVVKVGEEWESGRNLQRRDSMLVARWARKGTSIALFVLSLIAAWPGAVRAQEVLDPCVVNPRACAPPPPPDRGGAGRSDAGGSEGSVRSEQLDDVGSVRDRPRVDGAPADLHQPRSIHCHCHRRDDMKQPRFTTTIATAIAIALHLPLRHVPVAATPPNPFPPGKQPPRPTL